MAFKLGDIVIDRIAEAIITDFDDNFKGVLTQLADATLETTAESKDAVDKNGTLVKRFWNAKTGTFTATNAMFNASVLALQSGSDVETATTDAPITMPRSITVKNTAGTSGTTVQIPNVVAGTVHVAAMGTNGSVGTEYTVDTAASTTAAGLSGTTLSLPLVSIDEAPQFIVNFKRTVTAGTKIVNSAEKFPSTVRVYLKVLAVDPCEADTLKAAYIYLPSFQPSPETSISLTTDGQLEFSGDLQVDYCSTDKVLFEFYWADDDEEE